MPTLNLTDRAIKRKPPDTGILELWDTVVPGLALRIGYGGKRTYTVTTRISGRQVRRKVGTTATHKLAEAREAARDVLRNAALGLDPYGREAKARAARLEQVEAQRVEASTFRSVAEAWLADTGKNGGAKLRSKAAIESQLERDVFPALGAVPITEIARADVRDLVRGIATKRPVAANRCLSMVKRVLSWAVEQDKLDTNPAMGIDPPGEEKSRERVLSDAEIAKLWPAFGKLGFPFGDACKLLLLTGSRRAEVGGMKWSEIEGDKWTLPGERTKNGNPHLVPLSSVAREILDGLPRIDGLDLVFTGHGGKPISQWSRPKEKVDKLSGVDDWRLHDLRRTLVTGMNEALNIEPHVIEAVVNHMSGSAKRGVAGVYNKAEYLPQRRVALESWAQHIMGIVSDAAESNVVELRKTR